MRLWRPRGGPAIARDPAVEPAGKKADERRRRLRILAAVALVLLIGLGLWAGLAEESLTLDDAHMIRRLRELGALGPVAVVALMVVHSFVPFPAEILAVCAGAVYGTWFGAALIWLGAMIGAALSFWLARFLGRDFVASMLSARQNARLEGWSADRGTMALLISRFIPVIAFNLINYAAGLTRVGWWTFLWTTALGILPMTLLMTYLGASMTQLSWPALLGVSVAGIGVVLIVGGWLRRYRGAGG